MAVDDPSCAGLQLGYRLGNVLMAGAVEAVTADTQLLLPLVGNTVGDTLFGDRTVEAGLKPGNLDQLGVSDLADPSGIEIYPVDFEAKDKIEELIAKYNEGKEDTDQIVYTDYVGLMMSSITTIINAISYILIAFVGISLVVSSIMIGIITNISVLERTKEIGILRAVGASKGDVSRVFNAETFIVGLAAGLVGIGVTELLLIPTNFLINTLAELDAKAVLDPVAAVILVAISVVLTLIAGLIPSRNAANKDPVVALRTE